MYAKKLPLRGMLDGSEHISQSRPLLRRVSFVSSGLSLATCSSSVGFKPKPHEISSGLSVPLPPICLDETKLAGVYSERPILFFGSVRMMCFFSLISGTWTPSGTE